MKFKKITACLDMLGCPNRCKHCWLNCTPNGNLKIEDLEYVAKQFRPFSVDFEIYDWYREPDYHTNYQEMWEICQHLSTEHTPHFELISFWRLVRDPYYVKWLSSLHLKTAQLTLFGDEQATDFYVGRKGAYQEILKSIDILLENGICPRIQVFITKKNIQQLSSIEHLITQLNLEKRCQQIGRPFSFFIHQGSCEGENEKFYKDWITPDDLTKIPKTLAQFTLDYFGKANLMDVFGQTEQNLYKELINDYTTQNSVSDTPVFYIDKDFNVYPNLSCPTSFWCLGNLKKDGCEQIIHRYVNHGSIAQHILSTTPTHEMIKTCGHPNSQRLFPKDDYRLFILNQYCKTLPPMASFHSLCTPSFYLL